jgi:hypothetical protein
MYLAEVKNILVEGLNGGVGWWRVCLLEKYTVSSPGRVIGPMRSSANNVCSQSGIQNYDQPKVY